MTNGGDARKRTDRAVEFNDGQRIWMLERDLDQMAVDWKEEIATLRKTLQRISGACIGILTLLVGSLALLVIQGR